MERKTSDWPVMKREDFSIEGTRLWALHSSDELVILPLLICFLIYRLLDNDLAGL